MVIPSVVFCCQSGHFSPIRNNVTGWEFYWSDGHEFYPRLGICNWKSVWSTDKFVRKLIILGKNESPLEKKKVISLKDIFFKQFQKGKFTRQIER